MKTTLAAVILFLSTGAVHAEEHIPIPRQKPEKDETKVTESGAGWPAEAVTAARLRCGKLLAAMDISYTPVNAIGSQGQCGAPAPIEVAAIAGVSIKPAATMTCDLAAALHGWIAGSVQPAAEKWLGAKVTEIHNGASYVCRRRNNGSSGKLSEHAKANALDMSGFGVAGKSRVAVGEDWEGLLQLAGAAAAKFFMDGIRADACKSFTTVLGPGSDPNHGDHFHVDVLERKGGYRICQ